VNEHTDETAETVESTLAERELFVVSNREPYTHSHDGDEIAVSQPAGGVTSALDPIVQRLSGTWLAWGSGDADFEVTDDRGRVAVPPDDPAYTLQRLHLSDRELAGYYYGYSNQVLWPVCHGMPTRANFDGEFWRTYREVNETFADALVAAVDSDDPAIWFQDYHFALAPRMVRERLPNAFLTQFWHVPWPSWETFRHCPEARQLLEGLLANDLLGFHRESYCDAFRESVTEAFEDASIDAETGAVTYDGHTTRIQCEPLGIDADGQADAAASEESDQFWATFEATHDLGDKVAVGVDRLDYTKGILERLDALEWLWTHRPDRRGSFSYIQKGSESRSQIDEYRKLQEAVERRVTGINERFGTDDWMPVVYDTNHYSRAELGALYRHADVGIVSPLCDGMNLVAKEYVASQLDDDGVLVLSPFAGAVDAMGDDALLVNPTDTAAFASTIAAAFSMPERTRKRRMRALRRVVHGEDTDAWVRAQFTGIDAPRDGPRPWSPSWQTAPVSVWAGKASLEEQLREADGLFVMTDLDGTVAEIVSDPDRAKINGRARAELRTLADHPEADVAVISGRAVEDVRKRTGIEGVHYAGNHGLELHDVDGRTVHPSSEAVKDVLPAVCASIDSELADIDGVFIESKGVTATVHYRDADMDHARVESAVRTALEAHDGADTLRVTRGKQVVELRPDVDWGKGTVTNLLLERYTPDDETWLPVYVGDDRTDEPALEAVDDDGFAVTVGSDTDATAASYVVDDPSEAADLFGWLAAEGLASLEETEKQGTPVIGPSERE
jgi:trehalose 6-phosphate synthase